MQSSEFNNEMGALIRSLEWQVRNDPGLASQAQRSPQWVTDSALDDLQRVIVSLVALHIQIRRQQER